jgi:outer membrane receptor protein involved in Fe transport
VLTLLNGRRFPISTDIARLPDVNFPVAFLTSVNVSPNGALPRYGSDAAGGVIDLRTDRWHTGGEVGLFYGKSGGKFGREDFETYGIGTIATDKISITAGVMHQEIRGRDVVPGAYGLQR